MTTRERMLDNVIRQYGFESPKTIKFARLCETGEFNEVCKAHAKLIKGTIFNPTFE